MNSPASLTASCSKLLLGGAIFLITAAAFSEETPPTSNAQPKPNPANNPQQPTPMKTTILSPQGDIPAVMLKHKLTMKRFSGEVSAWPITSVITEDKRLVTNFGTDVDPHLAIFGDRILGFSVSGTRLFVQDRSKVLDLKLHGAKTHLDLIASLQAEDEGKVEGKVTRRGTRRTIMLGKIFFPYEELDLNPRDIRAKHESKLNGSSTARSGTSN